MGDDDAPRPARGCLAFLGVLLAVPAFAGLYALLRSLLPLDSTEIARALAIQLAVAFVVAVFLLGVLLVLHGLRGTRPLPPRVLRVAMDVCLFAGLLVACVIATIPGDRGAPRIHGARTVFVLVLAALATSLFAAAADLWTRARGRRPGLIPVGARVMLGAMICILFIVGVTLAANPRTGLSGHDRSGLTETINNARCLSILLSERSIKRGWPPCEGRNLVLSLVTDHVIDPRNPDNLRIFFSPCLRGARDLPPTREYLQLTPDALRTSRFPSLTDFAGRRSGDSRYALGARAAARTEPLLACVLPERGVVVGFTDGSARFFDLEDLGLEPGVPIELGDRATNPLLRALSDE